MFFPKRRLIIPEVIQSSAMDCGPASLKALLEGFGISVSYGRLREACQTSVDGTSIDTMEEVANQLGLEAEQIMLPPDHFFLPEAASLPALVVVRLPNGVTHFVVVWRRYGAFIQVMDPATGRRWVRHKQFLKEIFIHRMPVPASDWREWAGSGDFLSPLTRRLLAMGIRKKVIKKLIDKALSDSGWHSLGALDAATRTVDSLISSGGLHRGQEAALILQSFVSESSVNASPSESPIPQLYWSVHPTISRDTTEEHLIFQGMVLVRILGTKIPSLAQEEMPHAEKSRRAPELEAALKAPPLNPGKKILGLLKSDGLLAPMTLGIGFLFASIGIIIEAILLRGLFEIGSDLCLIEQRLGAMTMLLIFSIALLLLEFPIGSCILSLGRRLEVKLRIAFLEKLPHLQDRYFQSRLNSDMAERCHSVHLLRLLPGLGGRLVRSVIEFFVTIMAILWLFPESLFILLASVILAICMPFLCQSFLTERDLRVRSHLGALSRFYLDTLLGLVPIQAHSSQRPIRREHESMVVEWSRASLRHLNAVVAVEAVQNFIGFAIAFWLLFHYYQKSGIESGALLLVYWGLSLSALGQQVVQTARQYPAHRNITHRLLEPLGTPQEDSSVDKPIPLFKNDLSKEISISFKGVSVMISGHSILEELNLTIPSGSHLAVVGPSGAGKSSLVGLLLDWHRPSAGRILINGKSFTPVVLDNLRRHTAWIDPGIQLWNKSLINNIYYGAEPGSARSMGLVLKEAQLMEILEKLPHGLGTFLGEGGGLVSGGEGQRVRMARAMAKDSIRLVILDEPFRGLDHEKRNELLKKARCLWKNATLLCITHDVSAAKDFDKVIVLEHGRIVEAGEPKILADDAHSLFRNYLDLEQKVAQELWSGKFWRRITIDNGRIVQG